ncbi:MAG: hypothetical protein SVM79_02335, partial [Chloroflexota bacterium]|nr:hypothetical protein [Chloroflexota bacterium]
MKKNTVRRFLTLSVILIAVFSTAPVLAAGLQVHPGKIAIEMKPGGYHNTILLVRNDQKDESHYEVYIQEEYENWASFDIEAFSLLSHQSKNVEITIT